MQTLTEEYQATDSAGSVIYSSDPYVYVQGAYGYTDIVVPDNPGFAVAYNGELAPRWNYWSYNPLGGLNFASGSGNTPGSGSSLASGATGTADNPIGNPPPNARFDITTPPSLVPDSPPTNVTPASKASPQTPGPSQQTTTGPRSAPTATVAFQAGQPPEMPVGDGSNQTPIIVGACFAAGTRVLMADGSTTPIERVVKGNFVLSVPDDNPLSTPKPRRVDAVYHNNPAPMLRVSIGDQAIRCTAEHPFYVIDRGWIAANLLRAGDELRTSDGSAASVVSVEPESAAEPVFNLQVQSHHTYFVRAAGDKAARQCVLVHNDSVGNPAASGGPAFAPDEERNNQSLSSWLWEQLRNFGFDPQHGRTEGLSPIRSDSASRNAAYSELGVQLNEQERQQQQDRLRSLGEISKEAEALKEFTIVASMQMFLAAVTITTGTAEFMVAERLLGAGIKVIQIGGRSRYFVKGVEVAYEKVAPAIRQARTQVKEAFKGTKNAIEEHHLLPQGGDFPEYFMRRGLNIEEFTILLPKGKHRLKADGGVHTGNGIDNWNGAWKNFKNLNPNATAEQILKQLAKMREDFGI